MTGSLDFTGRIALVTGAASGIGAATARFLDAHGIGELILVDLDRPGLEKLDLSCKVRLIGGDVSDPALWTLLARDLSGIDHAVINAGIASGAPLVETDIATWKKVTAVNLDGAFLALRFTLQLMQRAQKGSVVMTASVAG